MANVRTGEVVFPIFVTLNRPTMNEVDLQELDDILIRFDYVEDIKWISDVEVELQCRVADVDDFDHEELDAVCNDIEKEVHEWEEKGDY